MSIKLKDYIYVNFHNPNLSELDDANTVLNLASYYSCLYHTECHCVEDENHRTNMMSAIELILSDYTTETNFKQIIKLAKEES